MSSAPSPAAAAPWRGRGRGDLGSAVSATRGPPRSLAPHPHASYALSIAKHPDPIGAGLAVEAVVEAAGPDCVVPGLGTPVRVLGMQVWPIPALQHGAKGFNAKGFEPVARELRTISKFAEQAIEMMNAPFGGR